MTSYIFEGEQLIKIPGKINLFKPIIDNHKNEKQIWEKYHFKYIEENFKKYSLRKKLAIK